MFEPTFVVTGRFRSGTSMMMHAISLASSLVPVVDLGVEAVIRSRQIDALYDPNPNGYYHAGVGVYPDNVPGSLVKCSSIFWTAVNPGDYYVVEIVRDENERAASLMAGFGLTEGELATKNYVCGEMDLHSRTDVNLITFNYADVVADPVSAFTVLQQAGWPISNIMAAANTVTADLYRHRV